MAGELFNKLKLFKSRFHKLIADDNIKSFILGEDPDFFDDQLDNTSNYLLYMGNCLTLAYMYAYGCYRQMMGCCEKPEDIRHYIPNKDSNVTRVLSNLKKTYVQYPVTPDLIQHVILDIQFDMFSESPNLKGVFGGMCNFTERAMNGRDFNLVKYFNHVAKWRLDPNRYEELRAEELIDLFMDLINHMTCLRGHLCKMDNDYVFLTDMFYETAEFHGAFVNGELQADIVSELAGDQQQIGECVLMGHTVITADDPEAFGFYYLGNLECRANALDLAYTHTSGAGNLFFRVSNQAPETTSEEDGRKLIPIPYGASEYYFEITGVLQKNPNMPSPAETDRGLVIHTVNYKYIKNLVLAVTDALAYDLDAKRSLKESFGEKHPQLFGQDDTINALDSTLIMLMIEESTTHVLERLFSRSENLFYKVVRNINRRFDDKTLLFYGKQSTEELGREVDQFIKEHFLVGERMKFKTTASRKDEIRRLRPTAQAELIVRELSKLVQDERQSEYIYAGNIYANTQTLKGLKKNPDTSVRIEYVRNILIDTFKHLICFYAGVFAYGEKKVYFDIESMNTCLSRNRIAAVQKDLLDHFMAAARKKAKQFKQDEKYANGSFDIYIDEFVALCNQCYRSAKPGERSYRDRLYSAIGKYEIMDLDAYNRCRHETVGQIKEINAENVDKWIDFALQIMEFLKSGSFSNTPIDHCLWDAVYPFTASYSKRNENKDGQITVTFSISIDIDSDGESDYRKEINVLTEFSYNLQEVFYCLPNVQRSNDQWWIDPLLISFTAFNSIFD